MPRPALVCLLGPTASGKTDLAVELARSGAYELVSVDSALVYRGLDIGAARPDYPHHLIDIRDPSEVYSAAEFAADAHRLAREISDRGRTPLLVGGTMLYFRAFLDGLAELPPADPALRAGIAEQAARFGWPRVHARLAAVDPESAARIHPNHSQRLSRALEVFLASGVPLSTWQRRPGPLPAARQVYEVVQLAISPAERALLHGRIERRLQQMMGAGLLEEVRRLHRRGDLHPGLPALRSVGYRQLWQFLEGECSLEEALERAAAATRQLARRQLTWLRKWPDLHWIHTDCAGNVVNDEKTGNRDKVPKSPLEAALNYLGRDLM